MHLLSWNDSVNSIASLARAVSVYLSRAFGKRTNVWLKIFEKKHQTILVRSAAAGSVSLRITEAPVEVDTKTKDNVFVKISVNVQYAAIDTDDALYNAYYKLTNPRDQLAAYVDDSVRSFVPHSLELDELFEAKQQVADHVESLIGKEMQAYGYRIVAALVTNVVPEASVQYEMNEINANKRLRQAAQETAEGSKYLHIKHAEAQAQSTFLQGEGIARQRKAIMEGLKGSVEGFSNRVTDMTAKEVLDLMMITQYFDTIKDLGQGKCTRVVLAHKRAKNSILDKEHMINQFIQQQKGRPVAHTPSGVAQVV